MAIDLDSLSVLMTTCAISIIMLTRMYIWPSLQKRSTYTHFLISGEVWIVKYSPKHPIVPICTWRMPLNFIRMHMEVVINARCYTLVHGFCFFKLFIQVVKSQLFPTQLYGCHKKLYGGGGLTLYTL